MLGVEEVRVICSRIGLIGGGSKRLDSLAEREGGLEELSMPSVKQELFQVKRAAVATAASIGTPT